MIGTNEASSGYRIGLDKVIDQRNRIVAIDVLDPDCSDMRDELVHALDLLVQVLTEHFPSMAKTKEGK